LVEAQEAVMVQAAAAEAQVVIGLMYLAKVLVEAHQLKQHLL
jgi:hypothetical protein